MTEYTQRTSNREGFENPVMTSFKIDLMDKFYDLMDKRMKDVGAHYFAHNLIKNHLKEGHTVSSFYSNPDWQEKYWKDYWDCDPVDYTNYTITKINGCSSASWKVIDPNSDCMEDRKTLCQMQDGFSFYMQHDNGVLENFSIGWEKYDVRKVNRQKLAKLCNMISDFRIQHYRLNRDMFKDGYPAVDFVDE
jgi:hypothetical protein